MEAEYYKGDFRTDSLLGPNRGWFVGSFMAEGPRKTDDVEVKYWEYPVGPTNHGLKTSITLEVTLILKGKTVAEIAGNILELGAGDYVVITPNTPNNTISNILEAVQGLTLKAPSDVNAKMMLDPPYGMP